MIVFLFGVVLLLVAINGVLIARLMLAPEGALLPDTPIPLPSPKWTPTPTMNWTPTYEPTATQAAEPTATATPIPTSTRVIWPTNTPTRVAWPTNAPTRVVWPTNTPTRVRTPQPTNTPTPVIADWRGEYYSNANLSGSPAVVRNDQAIDFDWQLGAPATGLPADAFSAQWSRTVTFDEGRYVFHAVMDDGMRLYVDGERVIDEWKDGEKREVTANRELSAGSHALRVTYYERKGTALARLWWEKASPYPDWKGEYWSNRNLSGNPTMVRNDREIRFNWGEKGPGGGVPADNFSARWTRKVSFEAGTYRFYALVDDGVRVWVDDRRIIDAWYDHALHELTADYVLSEGEHTIRVEYLESSVNAQISLGWQKIGAPSYPDWKGEYWSNQKLEGTPALVRNDQAPDFNWGSGTPGGGLPGDRFSARWTRTLTFEPGRYRLSAQADDGVRVYVDGKRVLDEWHASQGKTYEVELPLGGEHALKVEFYEVTGNARIRFWWTRISQLQDEISLVPMLQGKESL
jgi:hypothetical protein